MIPENTSSPASPAAPQGLKPHRLIKLGVDVHWREHVVVRQIDGQDFNRSHWLPSFAVYTMSE